MKKEILNDCSKIQIKSTSLSSLLFLNPGFMKFDIEIKKGESEYNYLNKNVTLKRKVLTYTTRITNL